MDINETTKEMQFRHPWELSRTKMVFKNFDKFLEALHKEKGSASYINVGAGDMYFDNSLLAKYTDDVVHAVDIGYPYEDTSGFALDRKKQYTRIEDIQEKVDFAIMMDSLEYMEDDREYIRNLIAKINPGGYLFLTLPAYKKMFSRHDEIVGNLRRYDNADIPNLFSDIPGASIVYSRHFYLLLLIYRWLQLKMNIKIDPNENVTTGWKHSEKSLMTKIVVGILNADYCLGRYFGGLSSLVVCKIDENNLS